MRYLLSLLATAAVVPFVLAGVLMLFGAAWPWAVLAGLAGWGLYCAARRAALANPAD
ncbi:MAG TPA: hypothetical protein PLY54_04605 [Ottowia sp.]|nr:hypothetical protein [Ottowia sp.]